MPVIDARFTTAPEPNLTIIAACAVTSASVGEVPPVKDDVPNARVPAVLIIEAVNTVDEETVTQNNITVAGNSYVSAAVTINSNYGSGASALGANVSTDSALILGTPKSGTLTNCTGRPVSGITSSTATALGVKVVSEAWPSSICCAVWVAVVAFSDTGTPSTARTPAELRDSVVSVA